MVVSSYLVLQWFHLALLVRVGGMFFLGDFIGGSVNPEMITWQPISFGGVRFLDDRSGSLFFEGFIVTDVADFLSFGDLWLQSPRFCFYRTSHDQSSLQGSCSVATAICIHEIFFFFVRSLWLKLWLKSVGANTYFWVVG